MKSKVKPSTTSEFFLDEFLAAMFPDFLKSIAAESNHEKLGLVVGDDRDFELIEISDHLALVIRGTEM